MPSMENKRHRIQSNKIDVSARSPTIVEVTEESSPSSDCNRIITTKPGKFEGNPKILDNEYTSLKVNSSRRHASYGASNYNPTYPESSYGDDNSCYSASDELSSNSSVTSKMTRRQFQIFMMILLSSLSSSLTVCLFPPFFPRLAEIKGATATEYGLIIGTNCLVAFLVSPIIGNNISIIGVKYSFCMGLFAGGVCCSLTGFLEFFQPGTSFIACAVLIRIVHAVANSLVVASTFSYTASEFPSSVAKIFSITRSAMNIAQLFGPVLGGILYEAGGFFCPFLMMGAIQAVLAVFSICLMPAPDVEDQENCDHEHKRKKNKVSVFKMLSIPTIWFSFGAFIVGTLCNGFLSINLEPQVLRLFNFSPIYIGLLFGLKDGANSVASPLWGWLCDRNKISVKPHLVTSSLLVSGSFFLLGAGRFLGMDIELTVTLLIVALCINGAGIGGQQVVGVVDALHEASRAGYPDSPATQGLVAGLWSSLSGAGRFVSRAGSGFLVDSFGFAAVAAIACGLQLVIALCTFLYLVIFECSLVPRDSGLSFNEVAIVEQGKRRDEKVAFTSKSSPSESLLNHSVFVGIPNNCAGHRMATRIANSVPTKWTYSESQPDYYEPRSIW